MIDDGGRRESLQLLRDMMTRVVAEHSGNAESLWRTLSVDLGIAAAPIGEAAGGLGGGPAEIWVIMEALGAAIQRAPFLSSVVLGAGALQLAGGAVADRLLREVATGARRLTLAYLEPEAGYSVIPKIVRITPDHRLVGRKAYVLDAERADTIILTARECDGSATLFAVPGNTPGLRVFSYDTIDGGRAGDVVLDDVAISPDMLVGTRGGGLPLLDRVIDEATVAICAEGCGTMRALLDRTVQYVKQRRQFGRAISEFQVIQHRVADMLIAIEQAVSLAQVAQAKLNAPDEDRREAVSGAKILVSDACRFVAQSAVQLHGGIGMTEELEISIFFRRALMIESLFGSSAFHLARYESISRSIN